jgi:hypothetical protein
MLLLDDFEDDESNRRSGGVLCDEIKDNLLEYWLWRCKFGRSCLGDFTGCVLGGLGGACLGLTANEGQSLSFKIEMMRSRGL